MTLSDGENEIPTRNHGTHRVVRRRPQSALTRELILRATEKAILDLGISRITTRKLADLAGVSEATIFKYWPTKEELVLAALQRRGAPDGAILDGLARPAASIEEGLARIASTAVRHYDATMGPLIAAMADMSILPRHREWLLQATPVAALSAAACAYLDGERHHGRLRDGIDPGAVAEILLGSSLRHVVERMFWGDLPTQQSEDAFAEGLARGLALMISAPAASGSASERKLAR